MAVSIRTLCVALAIGGSLSCGSPHGAPMAFVLETPRDRYQAQLTEMGLDRTALGRDWVAAASRAIEAPVIIDAPHNELRYLDPNSATAVGYRLTLRRGQRLLAAIGADSLPLDLRVFIDLFYAEADHVLTPSLVRSADSLDRALEFVVGRPGDYILRVQPELLRGGRLSVTVTTHASLDFPVAGRDMAAIRSRFGAPRDGGRREHHGVDIFAPRGTPVVAAIAGRVTRVGYRGLGGNVVWLRDTLNDRSLYYAHLDRAIVAEGMRVVPGDTLGFVGNTGNARTTPPHLHFGIYVRRGGPVDPHDHIYEPPNRLASFVGLHDLVGRLGRTKGSDVRLRARPDAASDATIVLSEGTPVRLLAGSGRWYHVRLPDGRLGYVSYAAIEPVDAPLRLAALSEPSVVLTEPGGIEFETLAAGDILPILGQFGEFALVRNGNGMVGWIGTNLLGSVTAGDRD